jgi:glycoside/pentoside/hexuronide:cation symporter, GPH family
LKPERRNGTIMKSIETKLSIKEKVGYSLALAGWLFAIFKFVPNAAQSETTITGIELMISVFLGILYMSCAILLYFYSIGHKTCMIMQKELEERKKAENMESE